jgi:hypothetical protein
MAQHDYNIANQTGLEFRADLNNALSAVVTQNSGTTEPDVTFPGMLWLDTSTSPPVLKQRNQANDAWVTATAALGLVIGTTVQAFDADTAKTDVAQNFTAPQRSELLTDNDGSFDLSTKQNFTCAPTGNIVLTFTGISGAGGQSGYIKLVNNSNYVVTAHANTKISSASLSALSATGTYILAYLCDGTNVYVTASGDMS